MLSQAVEDYLKAIYKLQDEGWVSTTDLSAKMGVSPASTTNMVKRLSQLGLVNYTSYKGVRLSETGEKIALEIIRHHRLLETYLREIMGYDWEKMHNEAEHLEHHISEEFEQRLDQMLGYPTHDPHGDPIPAKDGSIVTIDSEPIINCPTGIELTIRRLSDASVAKLRELESVGVLPGTNVIVVKENDVHGGLSLKRDAVHFELAPHLTPHVFASPSGS